MMRNFMKSIHSRKFNQNTQVSWNKNCTGCYVNEVQTSTILPNNITGAVQLQGCLIQKLEELNTLKLQLRDVDLA